MGVGSVLRYTPFAKRVLLVLVPLATVCLVLVGCGGSSAGAQGGGVSGQHVSCPGDPAGGTHFACTTTMRLACQRGAGSAVVSQVPGGVNGVHSGTQVWFQFSTRSSAAASSAGSVRGWTKWVPIGGRPVKAGRASYQWTGARQAKALAKIPNGAVGGPYWEVFQVSANCRR